ncbi:MAG TPA: VTT domain-containing protein [Anaeromyxobacteraceae bacterium]|nr:VTT domain-containing protein [Anaeromyxobacteraceae bacterium]
MQPSSAHGVAPSAAALRVRLVVAGAALACVVVAARLTGADRVIAPALGAARAAGPAGIALHAAFYLPVALLGLPVAPLTFAAGAAYGPTAGVLLAVPATTLSASVAFLAGRALVGRDPEILARGDGRLARLARAVGRAGFRVVLVLRLSFVAPFGLLNYALGASPCRFGDFVLGTLVGTLPIAVAYAWAGAMLARGG